MSKYTMELRHVCDFYTREKVEGWFKDYEISDYLTPEQIQVLNQEGFWSKDKLAKKIVDHYFMREIGFETPALFKHYAKVTMQEIMEEKLPLLYSRAIKYDPLINVDFVETFERTIDSEGSSEGSSENNGTSSSESSSSTENLGIDNKTPQSRITKQNLDSGIYASNVSQNEASSSIEDETTTSNSSSMSSSNENSTTESYSRTQKGNSGVSATAQKMVEQFRDNIRAIDKEIIEELQILFMGLY